MLILAIVLITLALVCYSIGVWAEHLQRTLKPWHTAFFLLGLACDASGTFVMSLIAGAGGGGAGLLVRVMQVTGGIALLLMAVHAAWAIVVLVRDRAAERQQFHVFSLIVWAIWLVPYVTGAASSMAR